MGLLIRLILRNHLARIIVGAILIIVGLVFGITSKQVSYTQSNDNTTYQIAIGQQSGNVYINADGSNDYFVAFSSDFKVPQSEIDTPGSLSFIARSDTSTLDPALNTGGTTVNDAHKIEKLVLKDKSGNVIGTFTTSEYDANPNGTSVNNWPIGIGIAALGLLILILSFVFAPKKNPQAFSIAPVGGVQQPMYGQPMANPSEQMGTNPYAQPYGQPQQPNPYGQPQQPNPYGQPYQQPPQQ